MTSKARKAGVRARAQERMRDRCVKVAAAWKSPLEPGSKERLSGHREAAREIALALGSLKPEGGR